MPLALGIGLMLCSAGPAATEEVELAPGVVVHFATTEEGAAILGARDAYIAAQGDLERSIRLGTERSVPEEDYLAFVAQQALAWEEDQTAKLRPVLAGIAKRLAAWKLPWPERVTLVRTTGAEEAHAAYTRGSAVMLPNRKLSGDERELEGLLLHELFHVLSRANPELRDRLYAIVGFRPAGRIALPEALKRRRMTNPDAPKIEHVVDLKLADRDVTAAPILFAEPAEFDPQRGANLFAYMQFRLLVIERQTEGFAAELRDGEPILLDPEQEAPDYFEKIGRNTNYIIHPEEVLADNFVLLIRGQADAPTPRILTKMHEVLTEGMER